MRAQLLHECTNKARGVAQAGTALTFGSPRPGELEQAHEELLAVAMQMERDLLAIQEKCGGELDRLQTTVLAGLRSHTAGAVFQ